MALFKIGGKKFREIEFHEFFPVYISKGDEKTREMQA